MKNKQSIKATPKVHQELQGLELKINEFGQIKVNMNIDRLNNFLNKNVDDKKLQERRK